VVWFRPRSLALGVVLLTAPAVADEPAASPDPGALALQPIDAERPESGGRPGPTLVPGTDGYRYESDAFDATIRLDGRLDMVDRFPLKVQLPLLRSLRLDMNWTRLRDRPQRPSYGDAGDGRVPAISPMPDPWDEEDEVARTRSEYLAEVERSRVQVAEDGRDLRLDLPVPIPVPLIGIDFDVYVLFMKAVGDDPFTYQRIWIMDQTGPLRDRLADEARAEDLRRAMRDLRPRLSRIWNDRNRPPHARRRRIFETWDECEETTPEGRTARSEIESYVRDRLPCDGRDAYTDEELRALNARRESEEPFDPYAGR